MAGFSGEDATILWQLQKWDQGKAVWRDALTDFKGLGRWAETKIITLRQILQSR